MMRRRPIMRTVARTAVIAGTATVVAGGVSRRQQRKAQAQPQGAAPAPPAPPAPPQQNEEVDAGNSAPVPGSPDAINQLKELASLKDQGILTEAEFTAQKAKLLG